MSQYNQDYFVEDGSIQSEGTKGSFLFRKNSLETEPSFDNKSPPELYINSAADLRDLYHEEVSQRHVSKGTLPLEAYLY
jgi:hypothetical protein